VRLDAALGKVVDSGGSNVHAVKVEDSVAGKLGKVVGRLRRQLVVGELVLELEVAGAESISVCGERRDTQTHRQGHIDTDRDRWKE
jgi:hypothetical protein